MASPMPNRPHFILASASPRRSDLLARIGITADEIVPADIDETPAPAEKPAQYAVRMACEKAQKVAALRKGTVILAADTVVACGRRILPKAEQETEARACLKLLSGRRHKVFTAISVINHQGQRREKLNESAVRFKNLTSADIDNYIASGEWQGKAGAYGIQGKAAAFIPWISGSHAAIVGLPLVETASLLAWAGIEGQ